ncbi:unnamed protein product [Parnassius apollo]|uniref:(apollo) hypothetical protein n=1 Tax=Parnassius apollo TaxID=110799 RepID=A0A8S3WAL5_PARAO|nr:unnamed protein product [Parnassius apollo]
MGEVNAPPIVSPDDRVCEEIYVRTIVRDRDGRYSVALPFKGDVLSLGDSRQMAEKRFYSLERRMLASPQLKEAYDFVINEYIREGYISLVASKLVRRISYHITGSLGRTNLHVSYV